jgi:hypothetical protein
MGLAVVLQQQTGRVGDCMLGAQYSVWAAGSVRVFLGSCFGVPCVQWWACGVQAVYALMALMLWLVLI